MLLKQWIWSGLIIFLFAVNGHADEWGADAQDSLTVTQGSSKHVLTHEDFQKLHVGTVEVSDPVYKKQKRYEGYRLSDILGSAGIQLDPAHVLVFSALDGYQAHITVKDMTNSQAKAFVAIRDLDAPEGWEKIQQGKEWLSPAPFYLVWQTPPGVVPEKELPWPYQMVEISVLDEEGVSQKIFPQGEGRNGSVERGFKIFRQSCMACHSVNLEGGGLGPELNIPRNILEYRDREFLREFIKDPGSFRARNKMPAFDESLSDESLESLLDYLSWIGKHKVP